MVSLDKLTFSDALADEPWVADTKDVIRRVHHMFCNIHNEDDFSQARSLRELDTGLQKVMEDRGVKYSSCSLTFENTMCYAFKQELDDEWHHIILSLDDEWRKIKIMANY